MPFAFNFVPTPLSQASGDKRAGEGGGAQQAVKRTKLPPLTDLVAMESTPKKPGAGRLPAVAPLNICVYKIIPTRLVTPGVNSKTSPDRSCGRFRWTTRPGRAPCSTFAGVLCVLSLSLSLFHCLSFSFCFSFS